MALATSRDGNYLIGVVEVECNELGGEHVTLDVDGRRASAVATVLNTLIVIAGPEERDGSVGDELSKHVEGRKTSLVESHIPVLGPHTLTIDPVGIVHDVTSCKNIFVTRLKERIAGDTTILVHSEASVSKEPSLRGHTLAENHEVNIQLLA